MGCGGGFCRLKNFVFFALGWMGCVVGFIFCHCVCIHLACNRWMGCVVGFIFCPYLLIAFCGLLFICRGSR